MREPDKLEEMLGKQLELQRLLGNDFQMMNTQERIQFIKDMMLATIHELMEALDETTWKPWITREGEIDMGRFTHELNDAWQFIANMWFAAMGGADPHGVAMAMVMIHDQKIQVNRRRLRSGYDGVTTKCPRCGRALDDPGVTCSKYPSDCVEVRS